MVMEEEWVMGSDGKVDVDGGVSFVRHTSCHQCEVRILTSPRKAPTPKEATLTTMEEVSRCPACQQPGERTMGRHLSGTDRRSYSLVFWCRNSRCRWLNTSWIVQVRADGTFPPALKRRTKQFPALGSINTERLMQSLQDLYDLSLQGGEVRR